MPFHATMQVNQAGDIGGEGMSRFSWRNVGATPPNQGQIDGAATFLLQLMHDVAVHVPSTTTHTIQNVVQVFDDDSGKLVQEGEITIGFLAVPGTGGTPSYAGGSGVRVRWTTGTIVDGRVVRGAWFLVPLIPNSFTQTGGMDGSVQQSIGAAANTYVSSMRNAPHPCIVYHRPKKGATTGGRAADVLSAVIPGTPTSLRSRRV